MKTRQKLLLILFMLTQIILQAQDNTKIMELNAKGQEYLFNHNYEKAIKTFQKVLDIDSENGIAFRSLAYTYELSNEYELSDAMISRFISIYPMESIQ